MTTRNEMTLIRILLSFSSFMLIFVIVLLVALFRANRPRLVSIDEIPVVDRQRLVEEFFEVSTRAYTPAWFEPGIRYTLRQNSDISVFDSDFTSNALGYRSGPVKKAMGVFRVVFVGDSWTYGMGVDAEDSFPFQFANLANQALAGSPTVEAWSLALPAYNTMNEANALEIFLDRLDPDAVVFCPTPNDNDSSPIVVPVGATKRLVGRSYDLFGSDHSLVYRLRYVDSPGYMARWRKAFAEMKRAERYLEDLEIPFVLFFVARWDEDFVHHMVRESGIEAPYVIAPPELTRGVWSGPPPWHHGSLKCYEVLGRIIQRTVADELGWPKVGDSTDFPAVTVHRRPPPEAALEPLKEILRRYTESQVDSSYDPVEGQIRACVGPMDCATGVMGRATTFVLNRASNASRLRVAFGRIPSRTGALYPQQITVKIVSPGLATEGSLIIAGDQDTDQILEMELPGSARVGEAFDVEIRAERAIVGEEDLALRSVVIRRVWQAR